MDKKDAIRFEELYLKEDAYALKSSDAIVSELRDQRLFYLNGLSEERKKINFENSYKSIFQLNAFNKDFAEKFVHDTDLGATSYSTRSWILSNGMYKAYKNNDISFLKNSLHTMNRLVYGYMLGSCGGYNHSGSFEEVIYAFADCDIDLVKKCLPKVHGLADNNTMPFFRVSCNLIMGLIYKNPDWVKEAKIQCATFNERKSSTKNDVLAVKYLMALSEKDTSGASLLIQEIANNYKKINWLFNFKSDFLKFFGVYVHGLYNIANFVLDEDLFSQIVTPEHSIFWKEFDAYTKSVGFSKGNLMLNFDGELETVKRLFDE